MRLIDADKITTETFKAYVGENGGFISFCDAVDAIEAIPTAYDVDAILRKVRDIYECEECNNKSCGITYDGLVCQDVINKIKRGGV